MTVSFDGGKTPEKKGPFESTPGSLTHPSRNNKWQIGKRKLTDAISIFVEAEDDGTGWRGFGLKNGHDFLGKASLPDRALSSLSSGIVVPLEDPKIGGTELHFRVEEFPKEPLLPPYPPAR